MLSFSYDNYSLEERKRRLDYRHRLKYRKESPYDPAVCLLNGFHPRIIMYYLLIERKERDKF